MGEVAGRVADVAAGTTAASGRALDVGQGEQS